MDVTNPEDISEVPVQPGIPVSLNHSQALPIIIGNENVATVLSSILQNPVLNSNSLPSSETPTKSGAETLPLMLSSSNDLSNTIYPDQNWSRNKVEIFHIVDNDKHSGQLSSIHDSQNYSSDQPLQTMSIPNTDRQPAHPNFASAHTVILPKEAIDLNAILSSSDTVILPVESLPKLVSSDTMILPNESTTQLNPPTNLTSKSSFLIPVNDQKPSLLSNISDRVVSLDSIPSFTLFRPHNKEEVCTPKREVGDGRAVIGSANMPEWLLELIKHQQCPSSQDSDNRIDLTKYSNEQLMSVLQNSQTPALIDTTPASYESESLIKEEEGINSVVPNQTKECRLERSDTIILGQESSHKTNSSHVTLEVGSHDNQKNSSDIGFGPQSTISTDIGPYISSQSFENNITLGRNSGNQIVGNNESTMNPHVLYPIGMNRGLFKLQQLFTGNNGDLSIVQAQAFNDGCQTGRSASPTPVYLFTGYPTAQLAEAKETQTDIVFGTNEVHFKTIQCLPTQSGSEQVQLSLSAFSTMNKLSSNVEHHIENQSEMNINQSATSDLSTFSNIEQSVDPQLHIHNAVINSGIPGTTDITAHQNVTSVDSYNCNMCKESFSSKDALDSHKKGHNIFNCDLCNASFNRLGNYTRHRKIHNLHPENEKEYQCAHCGRDFLQRCDLKRHTLIHTKQEPYRCDVCGKGYIRKSDLVVHTRFHTKNRAFTCSFCEKKFFQSGDLNRHIRSIHKPNNRLTCGHCDRKYACESTLIRHMKATHKDIILQAVNKKAETVGSLNKDTGINACGLIISTLQDSAKT